MHQWSCIESDAERWFLDLLTTDSAGNSYQVRNAYSNKCLAIEGASIADGASIVQWDCRGAEHQVFRMKQTTLDSHYLLQVRSSLSAISVDNASLADGAQVIQWRNCGCSGQYLRFSDDP
jgi:hypothetical protein